MKGFNRLLSSAYCGLGDAGVVGFVCDGSGAEESEARCGSDLVD
jgi:hypothetical protein